MSRVIFAVCIAALLSSALLFEGPARSQEGAKGQRDAAANKNADEVTAEEIAEIVKGNNEFAFELYRELRKTNEDENLFVSPYSLSSALAMAYAGARGTTAEEMARVLHFPDLDAKFHRVFSEVNRRLLATDAKAGVEVHIANALWGQSGFPFLGDYLAFTRKHYDSALRELDFMRDPEGAAKEINRWADENTRGRISEVVSPDDLSPGTRLVLTNAVYFKAKWAFPFDKERTREADFHSTPEVKVKASFMNHVIHVRASDEKDVQIMELPCADDRFRCAFILPRVDLRLSEIEKQLSISWFAERAKQMSHRRVTCKLPKFEVRSDLGLGNVLERLGMGEAMTAKVNLSGIATAEKLSLARVVQKTFAQVKEEGAEAAAVTAVATVVKAISVANPPPILFQADRPFLMLISDARDGSILFIGRVSNPGKKTT